MRIFKLIIIFLLLQYSHSIYSAEFTTAESREFRILTSTLFKWREFNQLSLPKTKNEGLDVLNRLEYLSKESNKLSNIFLNKFDPAFAIVYQEKFQVGSLKWYKGMAGLMEDKSNEEDKQLARLGQQLMIDFQAWYNQNIERISLKYQ
ncbi:MAG: hypothetical protein L3J46_00790 [Kangiellaceae bacterium]|nr:hypothetical protein [Kangiellaceae bacterium]